MRRPKKKQEETGIDWVDIALRRLDGIEKKCKCVACDPPKSKLAEGMRRIKVQPKYVERAGNNSYVPMIMLNDEWLRKKGFDCESFVIIEEEPGRLIIRLENA